MKKWQKFSRCVERQDSQIKDKNQLNSLSEAMNFMTKKFEVSERERQKKDNIIDTMKSDMVNLNEKIEKLERIVDRQEQYSRRDCLLLHGIAERERENIDELVLETLNEKMRIDFIRFRQNSLYWSEEGSEQETKSSHY